MEYPPSFISFSNCPFMGFFGINKKLCIKVDSVLILVADGLKI